MEFPFAYHDHKKSWKFIQVKNKLLAFLFVIWKVSAIIKMIRNEKREEVNNNDYSSRNGRIVVN